jgi:hypothetical protein
MHTYKNNYSTDVGGDALQERAMLKKRSEKYVDLAKALQAKAGEAGVELGELKEVPLKQRLLDVLGKFMPNGATWSDPEFRRICFLASLVVGKTLVADAVARYDGYILSTVLQNDKVSNLNKSVYIRKSLELMVFCF